VEALLARGHTVRVLDNLSTGSLENLQSVRGKLELVTGDLSNLLDVRDAMKGVEVLYHQVSPYSRPSSTSELITARLTNVAATLNVLIAARDAKVGRFIYSSSCCVYGPQTSSPVREDQVPYPLSPEAAAFLAGEQDCIVFTYLYGLETVRLRYFNVYGPRQPETCTDAQVVAIIRDMLAGRRPIIASDGQEPRDLVYIDDVTYANILAMEAPRVAGRVYNIGRGRPTSLLDVVATVNAILGTNIKPIATHPSEVSDHFHVADISNAQRDLGFLASADLEQGITRCIRHYQAARDTGGH
jgi:UDP-glucose 4-epimerase